MLAGKLRPAALFYVLGQRAHGFSGDFGPFAAINRGFGDIDRGKDFRAATFTLKPAACDGLPDEILLLGG